jgi:predicted methyltransferase
MLACTPPPEGAEVAPTSPPAPSEEATVASPQARAIVDAADRTVEDRSIDAGRHPAELLTFLGIQPGARVGELLVGAGYTAELLGRAVAPSVVVYAENPRFALEGSDTAWTARLARTGAKTLVRVDRELEDPLPSEARELDMVIVNQIYHDTVWLGVDRKKMNAAVFAALKPAGKYVVIDHSARPGTGLTDVQTLHRIDEQTVRAEIESAGFQLERRSAFLRNPGDTRDWSDGPRAPAYRRGTSDRFALMFVKRTR